MTAAWYLPMVCAADATCKYTEYGDGNTTELDYPLFRLSADDLVESWNINGADGVAMTSCLSTDNAAGIALTGALSLATTFTAVAAGLLTLY